jgi:hypothetical protein
MGPNRYKIVLSVLDVLTIILILLTITSLTAMYYATFGDFSASKSAVDFTLNGNYSIYQTGRFQYESVCSAQIENSMLCDYVLPGINVDKSSAIEYSRENCVRGQIHSGSYNSKTLICDDTVEKYTLNDIKMIILYTGLGLLILLIIIGAFMLCNVETLTQQKLKIICKLNNSIKQTK